MNLELKNGLWYVLPKPVPDTTKTESVRARQSVRQYHQFMTDTAN